MDPASELGSVTRFHDDDDGDDDDDDDDDDVDDDVDDDDGDDDGRRVETRRAKNS